MDTGLWPDRDEECSVVEYSAEYGGKHDKRWAVTPRPKARCPACRQPMKLVGEDRPPHDRHFSHIGNSENAPYCPLRNIADYKYEFLEPAPADSERGCALRASFFRNWRRHWRILNSHLDGISDVFAFIKMIHIADRTRLWNRPSLEEWEIPYIFLVWQDYPPVKNKRTNTYMRKEWYRFWFDSRVRTLEDIWILTQGRWTIVRAMYAIPRSGKAPGIDQLRDTKIVQVDEQFLTHGTPPEPRGFVIVKMHEAFSNELGPWPPP